MNPDPLRGIRSSLAGIRRRRALARISSGFFMVLLITAGLLAVLFGLDLCFRFSRVERAGLLVAFAVSLGWTYVRWLRPALAHKETELQLALWIERDHPELRGTLANAMQFAAVNRGTWGSSSLEEAAVSEIATLDRVPPLVDPQATRCGRLVLVALLALAAVGGVCEAFPEECRIFANRFLLGAERYPTGTKITRIVVNGIPVFPRPETTDAVRIPVGQPLEIAVACTGVTPDQGSVHLQTTTPGQDGTLPLEPASKSTIDEPPDRSPPASHVYSATGNRVLDDVVLHVRIGDAASDPIKIVAVPLPAISISITSQPPDYFRRGTTIHESGSPPQVSVPAGSRAEFAVQCKNKELRSATLRIDGHDYALEQDRADSRSWKLKADDTPLASVVAPLAYELSVVDADELALREPMRGMIGVFPDEPPRATLSVTTLQVLPDAEPAIAWTVTDDHGVESVRLQWQLTGAGGSREGVIPLYTRGKTIPDETSARGSSRLPLSPLKAAPGDEIRLTIVAVDDRGTLTGVEGASEPATLHVTDEAGILSSLAEGDSKAASELDDLIERQLRSGEGQ